MGIHVALNHVTRYSFDRQVEIGTHYVRLRPAPHNRTPIEAYDLRVKPTDQYLNWQQDPFGNFVARLDFTEPADHLEIGVSLVAQMTTINPFDFFVDDNAENYGFTYDNQSATDLSAYLQPTMHPAGIRLADWLKKVPDSKQKIRIVDFLVELNQRLFTDIAYSVRMEPGVQSPEETLEAGVGSCRDSAWLLVEILRHLGLAARFVSGYLIQLKEDQTSLDGPDGPQADFTDLHAWAEVFLPGAGWVGLDPTSGLFAGEGHIPLAASPHPTSAAPIVGTTTQCQAELTFENTVKRVREDPRVTLPYTSSAWQRIQDLGVAIDRDFIDQDVRLTMGGEPTFVAIDDIEAPEWNTDPDGEHKREIAHILTDRLRSSFTSGALRQNGQGKWYPGEPLPRWRNSIFWRRDGKPLWSRPQLQAKTESEGSATIDDAAALLDAIRQRFGLPSSVMLSVFDDPIADLWEQAKAPAGDPPDDIEISSFDTAEHPNLDGHNKPQPVGFILPLHSTANGWASSQWRVRRNRVYLVPGDSPVGFRLPLDSLTWSETPNTYEQPAFDDAGPLPEPGVLPAKPAEVVPVHNAPSSAISVELHGGHVSLFLPPLESAVHAVELLAVVEEAAASCGIAIEITGYPLPTDPRIRSFSVTPDPGVIEVNMQPSASWDELSDTISQLYEQARLSRLGTEKFAIDGTHTGTGGGNHMTLGGVVPSQSPLLRRPDLLRSLVSFWQRHPSLSYLFSGTFIGPTSQAPRVDEARDDALYELEIAFAELEANNNAEAKPWLVDRLFRNLLVDITGNTHRSEFCIDKLYNPDSTTGRLGLLELRAFEMPPHPQMALVQALLVRSLVARFWTTPYKEPLIRWGTALHDRFMLSHFVGHDITEVVDDLNNHGIAFDAAWLQPFLEFRFPLLGETTIDGALFRLRTAIEPWNVLGEQQDEDSSARYVDSSVERVEVQVEGFQPHRHLLLVNHQPVPLQITSDGFAVAGVRFKAWSPSSSLHPTIDTQGPLRFDLLEKSTGLSLGGFTYHVKHPGGLGYETHPVNAKEAEARRASRFSSLGRSPNAYDLDQLITQASTFKPEFSCTLDLRRNRHNFGNVGK